MAQLIFNIPDTVIQRVIDGFATASGFNINANSGETKLQFLHRKVTELLIASVKQAEGNQAAIAARQTSDTAVDQAVTIT